MTTQHSEPTPGHSFTQGRVALRGPGELADALPYLLGFHPDDSIVLIALHGPRGRFGGRIRVGIPAAAEEWPALSDQLASCLAANAEARGHRPDGALVFLCQDPSSGRTGRSVMEKLRPLAQCLRISCGELEMPVYEALCISAGSYWSYTCPDRHCCPEEGSPVGPPGTSAMAAAAACAGIQVQGSLKQMEARLEPLGPSVAQEQEQALDAASMALVPQMLGGAGREKVGADTLDLAGELLGRFRQSPPSVPPRPPGRPPGSRQVGESSADPRIMP